MMLRIRQHIMSNEHASFMHADSIKVFLIFDQRSNDDPAFHNTPIWDKIPATDFNTKSSKQIVLIYRPIYLFIATTVEIKVGP